ncbi:MAG: uridine diphosphate-N-acetylglucosamine-binding protein YvcK [Actinobacteria bacterium]|uniref:Unannotated protein n=1 Tax=freshwater metagenome TaxID=449393 RepID=A0A6J6XJC6_9ZZZZ|nr:uridine diphosphate-N-acetylglucosamine-binding protein YvcK [Actinomycetota bacterium]
MSGDSPRIVALGGGHGLSLSLRALTQVSDNITAVVTVADDGGSSGVLRRDLGVLPPGDLRMALAALADASTAAQLWSSVAQHRFDRGDLAGHPVGNLMLVALMEELQDPIAALDRMADLLQVRGRVLPMCCEPVDLVARLTTQERQYISSSPSTGFEVRGQVAVASTPGRVVSVAIEPAEPEPCEQALTAIAEADYIVMGPGSWFSSVLPHLLVPEIRDALVQSPAQRIVTLNLTEQAGETAGFSPEDHLEVLGTYAPELRLDYVLADPSCILDRESLNQTVAGFGADLVVTPVARDNPEHGHDEGLLASAYAQLMTRGKITPWP